MRPLENVYHQQKLDKTPGNISKHIMIYGAKSIALGVCCAVKALYPSKKVLGFLVSSKKANPDTLNGLPVMALADFAATCSDKDNITIYIGTPETAHNEIILLLKKYGFFRYICVDWKLEEQLMEQYFSLKNRFPSLHNLKETRQNFTTTHDMPCVFGVVSHLDKHLQSPCDSPSWLHFLQAGAALTDERIAEYADNTGYNISLKNGNYCEMTALYWIWKNVLEKNQGNDSSYYGLFQYRRLLNISEKEARNLGANQVDAILPFPTIHEPDMLEHHTRYLQESDWLAMLQALDELQPSYAAAFRSLSKQPYLYNYNILVAKAEILKDYCAWLFPILERTENLSRPRGWERNDRYIGYLGESLLTLYFLYHADHLKIVHTGKIMLV